jgi:hypothetical protein
MRTTQTIRYITVCCLLLAGSALAMVDDSQPSNIRWTVDMASRTNIQLENNHSAYIQYIGLDWHNVLTDRNGDIGTFVLQPYLNRIDNLTQHPPFFDDEDDWEATVRSFYFNFTGTSVNVPNIKFGRFILPFGIENSIDTSGALLDYNNGRQLGLKGDWGLGINKQMRSFEYELVYTLGSGQKIKTIEGNHTITGRIGSLRNNNSIYGFSIYKAKLKQNKRNLVAFDTQWYRSLWGLYTQLSYGKNASKTVKSALAEVNWRNGSETLRLYMQGLYFSSNSEQTLVSGFNYEPDNHLSASLQFKYTLKPQSQGHSNALVAIQLRYRF